jgi:hypothetical protein
MYFKELFYSVLLILSTFSTLYFASTAYAGVQWSIEAPTAREDGTPLPPDEIGSYTAYITGTVVDDEVSLSIPGADLFFVFTGRDYGCATMDTVDTDGTRSSFRSNESCKGTFPEYLVELMGPVPEEKTIVINVSKPGNATEAAILMSVYDADFPDEGALIINGNTPISLFDDGVDGDFSDVIITTPGSFWNDGDNTLLFTHVASGGYVVNAINIEFATMVLSPPSPPVVY